MTDVALSVQQGILDNRDLAALDQLNTLMRETYQLWDHEWVGFSWRNYTYDHVRRVRNLAISLGMEENADIRVIDFAAVLHDITKSYDGEVVVKDGARVLDDHGFWRNEFLPPTRQNAITALYDTLGLAGSLHNVSGARIADALLEQLGYPSDFRAHVAEVIVSHLKITDNSSLEGRCLYDADTIDANIGHPAFYRNIQISMHRLEQQHAERGESTDTYLSTQLLDYLQPYVNEKLPAWVGSKERDFVQRLTTEAGRRRALARIRSLERAVAEMQAEIERF